jgi:hypothetical protein
LQETPLLLKEKGLGDEVSKEIKKADPQIEDLP